MVQECEESAFYTSLKHFDEIFLVVVLSRKKTTQFNGNSNKKKFYKLEGRSNKKIATWQMLHKKLVSFLHEQDYLKYFECLACKQITNNAMKLTCKEYKNDNEVMFIENDNQCPIDGHDSCKYKKGISIRKNVKNLTVICPRQFAKNTNANLEMNLCCKFNGKIKDIKEYLEE
ncbi:hypothetical protein RFI_32780 [Reticulomyxa filosa]|uniref:Uncharacterized protein n=1 Tax=Reticulomyxa filosa TaxID=46433 RepID=X6LU04_RETFI|nr:hypothetical protein RFI_32780 [Reticulomyxa filosa]|eukprot:ETO04617.1 hypothetical protein RFI_32780 [Reticulomyxa filosa]